DRARSQCICSCFALLSLCELAIQPLLLQSVMLGLSLCLQSLLLFLLCVLSFILLSDNDIFHVRLGAVLLALAVFWLLGWRLVNDSSGSDGSGICFFLGFASCFRFRFSLLGGFCF